MKKLKNHLEQIVLPVGFRFNTGSIVRKMDILVHPSRFEGKSNTIDEALHYNVPVVATNFETVYEQIIDGENGFIVNMDGNEISLKIEELKNNKELYQIIKSNLESAPNENIDKGKEFIETIKHIGVNKMLTIFTPTFNRAHTLPRLYESLLNQTDYNFE